MAWDIALVWGLGHHFCQEKRASKKKIACRLRGTPGSCTAIFNPENGRLRLQKRHFRNDIP
jgi:hypothetical protein